MSMVEDGTRIADSQIQATGGHAGHVEGGAEMMWELDSQLCAGLRELKAEIERLKHWTCSRCGEPAALRLEDITGGRA